MRYNVIRKQIQGKEATDVQRYLCNGQVHLHSPYEPDMTFVLIHRVVEAWDDMDAEDIYLNHLAESDIADHIRFIETKITPLA